MARKQTERMNLRMTPEQKSMIFERVISQLMKKCGTKKEFIDKLKKKGYGVRWEMHQKTMTYTCPNGMKVRDNKLHDARFMKEAMEHEFRIREQHLEQIARFAEASDGGDAGDNLQADSLCDTQGALGTDDFTTRAADRISGKVVSGYEANAFSAVKCLD